MSELQGLPIIFGVTGHRDVAEDAEAALRATLERIFAGFEKRYPSTPLILLTALAAGADRLAARVAHARGIRIRVPMPLEEAEYRKDFDAAENAEFDEILGWAEAAYSMPFAPGNDPENVAEIPRRAEQYQLVGEHLSQLSHVLIALWDGTTRPSRGGTSQIVAYRLSGSTSVPLEPELLLDTPATAAVYHVCTPRASGPAPACAPGSLKIELSDGTTVAEDRDPFCPLYARIERFNRHRKTLEMRDPTYVGKPLRAVAEALATSYQHRYKAAANAIFILATVGALCLTFGHADHPNYALALLYCAFVFGSVGTFFIANAREWKDCSIEYRALEIGLTIQAVWDAADVRASAADSYLRIQRGECDWIRFAVQTVHHLGEKAAHDPSESGDSLRSFLERELDYFVSTSARNAAMAERLDRFKNVFFVLGLCLSVALLAAVGVALWQSHGVSGGPHERAWRIVDEIIRSVAAATIMAAAIHEYSKRLAFQAQARRYTAMLAIYRRALDVLTKADHEPSLERRTWIVRNVAQQIGREAIGENGEWLLMQRDLPIAPLHV